MENEVKKSITRKMRMPESTDVKFAKIQNQNDVTMSLTKLSNLNYLELQSFVNNHENKSIELLLGRLLFTAINDADAYKANFILDRMVGKVKEQIDFSGDLNFNVHKYVVDYIATLEEAKK